MPASIRDVELECNERAIQFKMAQVSELNSVRNTKPCGCLLWYKEIYMITQLIVNRQAIATHLYLLLLLLKLFV